MPTKISYLDEVWNPVTGCSGKGCKANCWARDSIKYRPALHGVIGTWSLEDTPWPFEQVQFHHNRLDKPLHWKKPRKIGVCFMGDLFDDQVKDEEIESVFTKMYQADWHTYFLLTKQVGRMFELVDSGQLDFDITADLLAHGTEKQFEKERDVLINWMSSNHVYWGVSITDQEDADRMIPDLLKIPGKHWVSYEPALGPVSLRWLSAWPENAPTTAENPYRDGITNQYDGLRKLDWVVVGCESGPKRRPMKPMWALALIEQCDAADIPIFIKQLNFSGKVSKDIAKWPGYLRRREYASN